MYLYILLHLNNFIFFIKKILKYEDWFFVSYLFHVYKKRYLFFNKFLNIIAKSVTHLLRIYRTFNFKRLKFRF